MDPAASLTYLRGTLFSTAGGGSGCACGVVFSITPSGSYSVVYTFKGGMDGANPTTSLTNVNGMLYGTTADGGDYDECTSGCGTVFKITVSGRKVVLHRFAGGADGAYPYSALANVNGVLYGGTLEGGAGTKCNYLGCGTLFKITSSGKYSVLHTFAGYPNDGSNPQGGMIELNGILYGTTDAGGTGCPTCGTVFKIRPSGKGYRVIHNFQGYPSDGEDVSAALTPVNGEFYGAAGNGGHTAPARSFK
ncbi:MAG TPA: choice-of-anchor tandem repeat GloVer-containing protein [Candidatus Cybelea sp.]|nr:choice-of-anchor tandem repeat GloVer-containing protein [Candidatus Cybelea sp.]